MKTKCNYCGSENVVEKKGKLVCLNCGTIILEKNISNESEIYYNYEEYTEEARHSKIRDFKNLSDSQLQNFNRIKNIITNTLQKAYNFPAFLQQQAVALAKQLVKKTRTRKDRVKRLACSIFYITCRNNNFPLSVTDLLETVDIDISTLTSAINKVRTNLKIETTPPQIIDIAKYILKNLPTINGYINHQVINTVKLLKDRHYFDGRDPFSATGAIISILIRNSDVYIPYEKIAEVCYTTTNSIRNHVTEILEQVDEKHITSLSRRSV